MKKLLWWDNGWLSARESRFNDSLSEVKCVAQVADVTFVGVPERKPVHLEVEIENVTRSTGLCEMESAVRRITDTQIIQTGQDAVQRTFDAIKKMEGGWLNPTEWERFDAIVFHPRPMAFHHVKVHNLVAFIRALRTGKRIALLDHDTLAAQMIELAERAGYTERVMNQVTVWGPYFKDLLGRENNPLAYIPQRFLYWPYQPELEVSYGQVNQTPAFDFGYVGNHWAANGSNEKHVDRLWPRGVSIGVCGKWPDETAAKIIALSGLNTQVMSPISRDEIPGWYAKHALTTMFMLHGKQKWPHLTPRVNEAAYAGVPLLWDARVGPDFAERCHLDPKWKVESHEQTEPKIEAWKYAPSEFRRSVVETQRYLRRTMRGGRPEDWHRAVEELCV